MSKMSFGPRPKEKRRVQTYKMDYINNRNIRVSLSIMADDRKRAKEIVRGINNFKHFAKKAE